MKKIIIFILPLLIGCSFQVKDTESEEDRLSRRPILEDEVYGEFNFDEGFTPYEYDRSLFMQEEINNRDRSPRELTLFNDGNSFTGEDNYIQDSFYRNDELNYERDDDLLILETNYNSIEEIKFE